MASAHTATVDKYLEAIYCIAAEGEVVRPGRLAYWLSVSAPTVSDALQRLRRDGWVELGEDRSVTLTDSGEVTATALVRRHRVLERWLTDVLGLDWASADVEADRLSSSISDDVVDRIDRSMGLPATCPHGNVIPGRAAPYGELVALADLGRGTTAVVRRISEVAEHEAPTLLTTLASHRISEGTTVAVESVAEDGEAMTVRVGEGTFELARAAAGSVWVERATSP